MHETKINILLRFFSFLLVKYDFMFNPECFFWFCERLHMSRLPVEWCYELDNVLGEAACEAGAVRLDIDLSHGAILHQYGESLAPGHSHPQLVADNIICYTWHCQELRSDPVQAQEPWWDLRMYQPAFLPTIFSNN